MICPLSILPGAVSRFLLLLFLPAPDIRRIASAAEFDDLAVLQQLCQRPLDGDLADIRALGHNLALGDLA